MPNPIVNPISCEYYTSKILIILIKKYPSYEYPHFSMFRQHPLYRSVGWSVWGGGGRLSVVTGIKMFLVTVPALMCANNLDS